jgi:LysM repeat protein|tara:strand:- start:3080 stop:4030 length:951 start_codon:yes stop_codon:yes gene_type:complete
VKIKIQKNVNILTEQEVHTVSKGETLSGIGKKYGVDWRNLAKINNIAGPRYIIRPGQKIMISSDDLGQSETETIDVLAQKIFINQFSPNSALRLFTSALVADSNPNNPANIREFIDEWQEKVNETYEILEIELFRASERDQINLEDAQLLGLSASLLYNMLILRDIDMKNPGPVDKDLLSFIKGAARRDLQGNFIDGFKSFSLSNAQKAKKSFDRAQTSAAATVAMRENQIFENYFQRNSHLLNEQMFEIETTNDLQAKVAADVEEMLDNLPEDHPVKTQDGAEKIYNAVLQRLRDPEELESVISSFVDDISSEIT